MLEPALRAGPTDLHHHVHRLGDEDRIPRGQVLWLRFPCPSAPFRPCDRGRRASRPRDRPRARPTDGPLTRRLPVPRARGRAYRSRRTQAPSPQRRRCRYDRRGRLASSSDDHVDGGDDARRLSAALERRTGRDRAPTRGRRGGLRAAAHPGRPPQSRTQLLGEGVRRSSILWSDLDKSTKWAKEAINYVGAANEWMRDFAPNSDGTYPFQPSTIETRKYFARAVVMALAPDRDR